MKIALYDPYLGKFTADMVDWWRSKGHEVHTDRYYDPELAWDADVIYFFTCDNNLLSATNPSQALLADGETKLPWRLQDMDLTNKRVIVQPIDIEVWSGHHAYENMWEYVDECIFIAPHIRDIMMADSRPQASNMGIHVVPFAINPDRWTYRVRERGFNIAMVSEVWESKGADLVLQIALKLKQIDPRYNIKWLGKMQMYHWGREYLLDFIKHNELDIEIIDWVDSVDEFLEDKNYLLHCSAKEAFSAATGEAMLKGIKPIMHRWFGADAIWPYMTWTGIDEAVDMITENQYDSASYRQYMFDHGYTTDQMMQKIDKIIKGEV